MEVGQEIVDCLSEDPGPIDGVYCAEVMLCVKLSIPKERFYDVLGGCFDSWSDKNQWKLHTWQSSKVALTARL